MPMDAMMERRLLNIAHGLCLLVLVSLAAPAVAAPPEAEQRPARPTIQKRFAPKESATSMHLSGTAHIRNDLYDSYGLGIDLGHYWSERWGAELKVMKLFTSLSSTADDLKNRTGLTPDTRAQDWLFAVGGRYSFGYGKVQVFDRFIVHFDPQWFAHGGITLAEGRVLPTMMTGMSLLNHFRWGLQFKVDLALTAQLERRDRGWIPSFGFAPFLGIGWSYQGAADAADSGRAGP